MSSSLSPRSACLCLSPQSARLCLSPRPVCRNASVKLSSIKVFMSLVLLVLSNHVHYAQTWSLNNLILTGSQATLSYADTVAVGAQKGLVECGRQFAFDRWSCPESIFPNVFQNNLPINREISFVQAIISAGIVYTVSKNCSGNDVGACPCSSSIVNKREQSNYGNFRWNGCSDNIDLGSKIAIAYLDARETGHDFKAQIRLHNNEVGRRAVKATMIRKCKCHGVSGACSMKTCWMTLGEFTDVGNYLREAYRNAMRIDTNDINGSITKSLSVVPKSKLVYSQASPDYCTAVNATVGSIGTLGRQCSKQTKGKQVSLEEKKSCRRLCRQCGYRVKRERRVITSSCNCKFRFCCEVECQQCLKQEIIYVCAKK